MLNIRGMGFLVVVRGVDGRRGGGKSRSRMSSRRMGTTDTYRVLSYGTTCHEHGKEQHSYNSINWSTKIKGTFDTAATRRTPRHIRQRSCVLEANWQYNHGTYWL